jgi:hypothetical protein
LNALTRFKIHFDQPLEGLSTMDANGKLYAQAFKSINDQNFNSDLFVIQAPMKPTPNMIFMRYLESLNMPNMMCPVDFEIAPNPLRANEFNYYFLFQDHNYKRFELNRSWNDSEIIHNFWKPAVEILKKFEKEGLSYRAIRLNNLFIRKDGVIVFGENISTPPGMLSPCVFEPIDQWYCIPHGREFNVSHDIYALGILTLHLMMGFEPWNDIADESIVQSKLHHGTYPGLMYHLGKKLSIQSSNQMFIEIIHRMLDDDNERRISLIDLDEWLNGKGSIPPMNTAKKELKRQNFRPLVLGGKQSDIVDFQTLNHFVRQNPKDAIVHIHKKDFQNWIELNSRDQDLSMQIKKIGAGQTGRRRELDHDLLFQFLKLIDPKGSILWEGQSFNANAMGSWILMQNNINDIKESLFEFFISNTVGGYMRTKDEKYMRLYFACNEFVKSTPDIALERLLYFLNPFLPCQSDYVKSKHIQNNTDLIKEIEGFLNKPDFTLDKDMLAFMIHRCRIPIRDYVINTLIHQNPAKRALSILYVIKAVVEGENIPITPQLFNFLCRISKSILDTYKNLKSVEKLNAAMEIIKQKKDINGLITLVNNENAIKIDQHMYNIAQSNYKRLTAMGEYLKITYLDRPHLINKKSRTITLFVGVLLSIALGTIIHIMVGV